MNKKKYRNEKWMLIFLAALTVMFTGKAAFKIVLAYQTDSGTLENNFTPGHNTTSIHEEFSEQSLNPGESVDIQKKVKIQNEQNNQNVPCYVRAKIVYSTEDFGTYKIQGMSSKWTLRADGYYYYTEKVPVGETTEYLMTGIHVDGSKADELSAERTGPLEIYIYEESCQTEDPDTGKDRTWKKAWEHALGRKIE